MEEQRRQFIPGLGILLLAALLLGAIGALLHDYREVEYRGVGALLWGGAVLITFVLGTVHLSRRVLPLQNNLGWAEGFRLLWRSYLMGANALLAGRRHEPLHTTTKSKKPSATTLSPSFQLLGAGFLFSHQAAAITRGNSFVRADGPGLVFLHPGEAIAQIFDLRTQSRKQPVEATTRDGILVKTSVSVSFHVRRLPPGERRPRSVETDTIPYPYDRQALFDLTYAGSVAGEEGRLSWADQICPQAATLLVGEIGRFTLDQLLVSGAAEPMGEIKANIKRGLEAMQTSEDGPTLPKGVTIASVGVGGVELPEDVVTKRLGTWQVEWHSQATGDIAVATIETQRLVNRARARAVADSIDSLLSSIETVQAQGQGGQLHEVILQQLTKSLETVLTKQVISDLPQRAQLMNLASSTSHELRRALERGSSAVAAQLAPRSPARAPRRLRRPPAPKWFNWPRVVLVLLLIGYWLFVRALERVDGNLVLAGIFLPDLSTDLAARVPFSPWLRVLVEFCHPRVLRHFIPIFVGWYLAVQAGVSLMQLLYNCPDRETAAEFLRRQRRDRVSYTDLPYTVLPHTLESVRQESILLRVGGPVQVIIPNGYAAVTERNARFLRVLPPGYHVLGRFEYLLGVVDLQPQSRSTTEPVSLLTREGIPVKAEVGLTFAIDPGDEPTPLRPFPFRPEAVRKAAYGGAVGANGKVSTWDSAPLGKATGALGGWVSSHTLDELLAADVSHDAHHLMMQAIIDKVWDKDGLLKDGIRPLRVHVGRLTPPKEVSQQYTEVWLAAQEKEDKLARANGTAQLAQEIAAVNVEGPMLIIQALADRLRQAQQEAGSSISGYVLAISLVEGLRQAFHASTHEARVMANPDADQLDDLADVSQRLAGLEDSLRRPTVSFNPSRPD